MKEERWMNAMYHHHNQTITLVLCYLEIVSDKAVDHRIHTAIQAAQSHSQMVHDHMVGHLWIEVQQHLRHRTKHAL